MEQDRMSVRLVKHNGSFCYMAETLHHGPGKYEWAAGKTAEAAVCALATRLRVGNEEGYQKISSLLDRPFIRKRRSPPPTLSSFDPR
jgi:hypothetical protein